MSEKKISDNKSFVELSNQMQGMDSLLTLASYLPKFMTKNMDIPKFKNQLAEISSSLNTLVSPLDKFNECFAEHGWIVYESLNTDTIANAIQIFENDGIEKAEEFLVNSYDENTIKFGLMGFQSHKMLSKRIRLLELAKEDYLAERYHACIPLLLSLIDGMGNDVSKHVGFFAEQSDLIVDDTISGHETGLYSVRKLLSKGRNKTTEEPISIPFRNGILHGRDLAFDNKIVAAKCWSTTFAICDWAKAYNENGSKKSPQPEKSFLETIKFYSETQDLSRRIDNWTPRKIEQFNYLPSCSIDNLPKDTPERVVAEFIENWMNKRWGLLRDMLSHANPQDKKIQQTKDDFSIKVPNSYEIIKVSDETAAISVVSTSIFISDVEFPTVDIRVIYQDKDFNLVLRDELGGSWKIMQGSLSKILFI